MKNAHVYALVIVLLGMSISLISWNCDKKKPNQKLIENKKQEGSLTLDSIAIKAFYAKYPKLVLYKKQVEALYLYHQYQYVWFDTKGKKEIAAVVLNKINTIANDGIDAVAPYKDIVDNLFQTEVGKSNLETELFLSNYYFFYANKALRGIDAAKTNELGWYLPRKKQSYVDYLDSLLLDPKRIDKQDQHISQYYKLKAVLQRYRTIEKKGGWNAIPIPSDFKNIKPNDSSALVKLIRTRLFLTGDIADDSGSSIYDDALQNAILKYKKRNGFALDKVVLAKHISEMNVPISERIKTIMVNMERCRWISKDISKAKEFVVVNIPSYKLTYFKNGKVALTSNVVVGNTMNETVIFSGMMSYIVFSPYWNVPKSIVEKEILPGIKKNKNYLEKHNMEWYKGNIRQKPGPDNSLGLVKFLFPNNNNIYLHDTPSKGLFKEEKRAFSHGCIRVEKPIDLANLILQDDPAWTSEKIDQAMHKGEESWYTLKNKIPVYIGYFTAWVDDEGNLNLYKDIYDRDATLSKILVEE